MTNHCDECGRSLALVSADQTERLRESTGFGPANERIRRFCSIRCCAHWQDVDPVLEQTQQATLSGFDADGDFDRYDPSAIAWGVH